MVTLEELSGRHDQHIEKVNALKEWVLGTFNPMKSKLATVPEGAEKVQLQGKMKSLLAEYGERRKLLVNDEGELNTVLL